MTLANIISFCVFVIIIQVTVQLECGYNEIEVECPANCPSDHCPQYEQQDRPCPKPEVCGPPECKCRFNTRRAVNGTCIPTQDCPPFTCGRAGRPNQEFVACPPLCPTDDCSQATPDGRCPLIGNLLFVVECIPKCRCIKGYWRHNGNCLPYSQCPQNQ